ncbi:hypothetical protein BKA62DRAFT_47676 [Auriculariales sp. MPI-PUGE-AT-0066]|nr:hypothetical protein BKA62DRAFT_47676 [Auriculariales sp. MPI-PUGE-AT-0066]
MSSGLIPHDFDLSPFAGVWLYKPWRQARDDIGWNASYANSPNWPPPGEQGVLGQGQPYFRTRNDAAQVSLNFQGTGVVFCFTSNGAQFVASVDGNANAFQTSDATADGPCRDTGAQQIATASNLDFKDHTAVLRMAASADHEFRFMGGRMTTAVNTAGFTSNVVDRWLDDRDPGFSFVPGTGTNNWDRGDGKAQNAQNSTVTFTCAWSHERTASYTFTGAGAAVLWGYAYLDTHDYQVEVTSDSWSDKVMSDMSTTGWSYGRSPMWVRGNLDPARTYALTLRNYNDDNTGCQGYQELKPNETKRWCCTALDGLQLFSGELPLSTGSESSQTAGPPPASAGGKSSANLGAILGGVFGGLALVAAIVVLVLFLSRRKQDRNTPQWDPPRGKETHTIGSVTAWVPPSSDTPSSPPTSTGYSHPHDFDPWQHLNGSAPPTTILSSHAIIPHPTVTPSNISPRQVSSSSQQTTPAAAAGEGIRLGDSDMRRVLSYVRRQINTGGNSTSATLPPPYRAS